MSRITVSLGGIPYEVPKLTVGELEALYAGPLDGTFGFKVARIALRRATPPLADLDAIEVDAEELDDAVNAIFEHSGMRRLGEKRAREAAVKKAASTPST